MRIIHPVIVNQIKCVKAHESDSIYMLEID